MQLRIHKCRKSVESVGHLVSLKAEMWYVGDVRTWADAFLSESPPASRRGTMVGPAKNAVARNLNGSAIFQVHMCQIFNFQVSLREKIF